jgi:hypothetical protein
LAAGIGAGSAFARELLSGMGSSRAIGDEDSRAAGAGAEGGSGAALVGTGMGIGTRAAGG